jgi:hypothetical protein
MKNNVKLRILPVFLGIVILCVTFLGTLQVSSNFTEKINDLKTSIACRSAAVLEVNGFIKGVFSKADPSTSDDAVPAGEKEKSNKKILQLLFLLISAAAVVNEKAIFILMLISFVISVIGLKKSLRRDKRLRVPPDIRHYMQWCLKFLSPVQKCIKNLAEKYTVNPIFAYGWAHSVRKKARTLSYERSAGFFCAVTDRRYRALPVFIGTAVLCVAFLGVMQISGNPENKTDTLKTGLMCQSEAVLEVNGFIRDVFSQEDSSNSDDTAPAGREDSSRKIIHLLLFILSAAIAAGEETSLILMLVSIVILMFFVKMSFEWDGRLRVPPDIRHYMKLCLKFLTPVQKCIQVLSRKYAMNPIFTYGWAHSARKKARTLSYERSAGFFFVVNKRL